jgi:gliding motility-associated-like protein
MKYCLLLYFMATAFLASTQLNISFSGVNNGQSFSTCNGFIIDSGGQGGPGYSNNENTVITICSDTPGDIVSVQFNLFNLSTQDDNPAPNVTNVDYMTVYDGTSTAANTLGTYQGNELAGVVIMATNLNPTGCLTFRFTSNSVGTGMFSASASCNTPCSDPVAVGGIVGGITTDSIRVCIDEPVVFQDNGSYAQPGFSVASYRWDFMDNTTANTANATHSFAIPGLYRVQLFVTDDNPDNTCVNNNLIDLQVLVAPKPDFTGFPGDATLCIGESITLTAVPENYEVLWNGFANSASIDDGCLSDNQLGVAQNVDLVQTGFVAGSTIGSVNDIQDLCFDLEHSFMGDLVIQIVCPNGQSMILHQQGGGGTFLGVPNENDGIDCNDPSTIGTPITYCFAPSAVDTWVDWVNAQGGAFSLTLPAGTYAPIDPFSNLVGCPTNGVWTLSVTDNWAADDGCLFSFGLNLDPSFYPSITTFEPQIGWGVDSSYWHPNGSFISNLSADGDILTITPTAAGVYNYVYTVIDDFGCTHDTSVNVTVNADPVVFAGSDTTLCGGAQLQLNGQVTGVSGSCTYTLDLEDTFGDGWNGNTLTVTIAGTATTYTLGSGLLSSYTLSIPDGATVSLVFNAIGSYVDEVFFSLKDPSGATVVTQGPMLSAGTTDVITGSCPPNFVFDWSPGGAVSNATILNPMLLSATAQTLVLSVFPTGHPACVVTDDIVIGISAASNAGADSTLSICAASAPEDLFPLLGVNATPGGAWFGPSWQPVTMPYDPVTMGSGLYRYIVVNGVCADTASVVVSEINTQITSSQFTDVDCNGANNGSIFLTATNFSSYSLNGAAPVNGTSPLVFAGLVPGAYTVQIFGGLGCQDSITGTITEPSPIQLVSITNNATICAGESVLMSAQASGGTGVYSYEWLENGNPVSQNSSFTIIPSNSSTTYCVNISDACGSVPSMGCVQIDFAPPIVSAIVPDIVAGCYPLLVNFSNTTASNQVLTTQVSFGDGSSQTYQGTQSFSHFYIQQGVFTVTATVTSTYGCQYATTYTDLIEGYGYPNANFAVNPNSVSMFRPEVLLINQSSQDAVSFLWNIPNGNPSSSTEENIRIDFPIDIASSYPVTLYATNVEGCVDSMVLNVVVFEEVLLFAPNTFTPDGDNFNEIWRVHTVGIDEAKFNLKVFNRWGQLVWESNDISAGWDGTFGGKIVPDGAYTWIVSAGVTENDKRQAYNGFVTILR